jgi:hypothetical protein
MDFQLKLFSWPDPGPHVIALGTGILNADSVREIFNEIGKTTELLSNPKILLDLARTDYYLQSGELENLVREVASDRRLAKAMIAIVSPRDIDEYHTFLTFSAVLSSAGLHAAAFNNITTAVDWLVIGSCNL